jgi:hypothetical protein
MGIRKAWAALAGVVLLSCGGAKPPPVRETRVDELSYFVGSWVAEARDPSTGRTFSLRYEVHPALSGNWYAGHGEAPELHLEIHDFWGRDPVTGNFVRVLFDSGGGWGTVTSPGWEGATLRFEGEARGGGSVSAVRETITRRGPAEFDAVWEEKRDGVWTAYSVEHLRKQP